MERWERTQLWAPLAALGSVALGMSAVLVAVLAMSGSTSVPRGCRTDATPSL